MKKAKIVKSIATIFGSMSAGIGLVTGIEFGLWYAWVLVGLGLFVAISSLFGFAEDCEVEEDV